MPFSVAMIGAGQFSGSFAHLFHLHPGVSRVYAVDRQPERADELVGRLGLAGTFASFEDALASPDVDAVAILTQRWSHGPLVVQALRAGKHVYSAVPMAVSAEEIGAIIDAVRETGLTYMMGETSHYNPAVVYARGMIEKAEFGRVFYAEGDYVHDMDLGFYDAYKFSGGEDWKATASYPPMLYPDPLDRRHPRCLADPRHQRVGDRGVRRPGRRCLRPVGQHVRQRLLQHVRPVRGGRRWHPSG